MSEPIALLVGGTKVLERELQNHLTMPLLSVATIEDAAKIIQDRNPKLIVLGPTLRRALATVTTLRREGQTEPRLMVVYRDDQRDEVKRHQKGRQVADSYIVQSRIQKEVGPAMAQLLGLSGESALEEIPADALSVEDDALSVEDDQTAEELVPQLPPRVVTSQGDVLGDYDDAARRAEQLQTETLEADALDLLEELPMMEDDLLEELDDGDLSMEDMTLEELPALSEELDGGSGDGDLLASDLLEDMVEVLDGDVEELALEGTPLPAADLPAATVQASVSSVEVVNNADLEALDLESVELDGADLDSADLDSVDLDGADLDSLEPVEEVVTADLIEEVSASAEAIEDLDLAELIEDMEIEPEAPAAPGEPQRAQEPVLEPVQEAPPPPPAVATESAPSLAVAALPKFEVAAAEPAQQPPAESARRQPSGAQAMFTELTSFVERLQDSAASIARLEAENEKQREELERAKQASHPGREAELVALRQNLSDLGIRLTGAEQARDAAVEARMRAELAQVGHSDELTKHRGELASARNELAAQAQHLSGLQQQLTGQEQQLAALRADLALAQSRTVSLEAQLDARHRVAVDSAKSLRAIATMLEG